MTVCQGAGAPSRRLVGRGPTRQAHRWPTLLQTALGRWQAGWWGSPVRDGCGYGGAIAVARPAAAPRPSRHHPTANNPPRRPPAPGV